MNGTVYILLVIAFIIVFLLNSDEPIFDFFLSFFSMFMTAGLAFSYKRMVSFLRHLGPRGVLPARKTITVQLVCLFLVSIMDFTADIVRVYFSGQCNDGEYDASSAGVISRALDLTVLLLWRVITFTMLIVYLR